MMERYDLIIIGAGPAGLSAALAAKEHGTEKILILERGLELGGILNQCIHNGFGLHTFHEELTGPEYAKRFADRVQQEKIPYKLGTMVLRVSNNRLGSKTITAINGQDGRMELEATAVILAMGCRERARGALSIPGYRPAGVYSAGTAQRLVNIMGYLPGREVVVLGSGDIGLIMARRMTLEGAKVKVVAELMPYCGGLRRNVVQCLEDYSIPLKLSHTVIDIEGRERVKGVTLAQVDENKRPIAGTAVYYSCDTLLLSCGLIPENEISKSLGVAIHPLTMGPLVDESFATSVDGVFACGNVLHVHDLVDFVSEEAAAAGRRAAEYVQNNRPGKAPYIISIETAGGVRYTVPNTLHPIDMDEKQKLRFRVGEVYKNHYVSVYTMEKGPSGSNVLANRIVHIKRQVLAPGEMEEITLSKVQIANNEKIMAIKILIERE